MLSIPCQAQEVQKMLLDLPIVTTKLQYDDNITTYATDYFTSRQIVEMLEQHIAHDASESSYAIMFDNTFQPLCATCAGKGTQMSVPNSVRDIIRTALLCNATAIILVHNHPNIKQEGKRNVLKPSTGDIRLVETVSKIGASLEIVVYDSLIVRPGETMRDYKVYSMRDSIIYKKKYFFTGHYDFAGHYTKHPLATGKKENIIWGDVEGQKLHMEESPNVLEYEEKELY